MLHVLQLSHSSWVLCFTFLFIPFSFCNSIGLVSIVISSSSLIAQLFLSTGETLKGSLPFCHSDIDFEHYLLISFCFLVLISLLTSSICSCMFINIFIRAINILIIVIFNSLPHNSKPESYLSLVLVFAFSLLSMFLVCLLIICWRWT